MPGSGWCWAHDPAHAEARRRRASKGGKRGGRGRPQTELAGIKAKLSALAGDVLAGEANRSAAAVVGQLLNTYIRAVGVELRVGEQQDLVERLEALEQTNDGGRAILDELAALRSSGARHFRGGAPVEPEDIPRRVRGPDHTRDQLLGLAVSRAVEAGGVPADLARRYLDYMRGMGERGGGDPDAAVGGE